ncbi:MAG: hypothetical protein LBT40_10410, partial [Deltaproteobacteria bacterium]|nr:hypothetical protein [Deltaproteobacteria bacterium]
MPFPPDKGHPANPVAADLLRQLEAASRTDTNPYRKGSGGELISLLGARFPEAALLAAQTFPFDGEGWMSGEALRHLAECALKRGAGLVELQPRGNLAFVPGTKPGLDSPRLDRHARPGAFAPVSLCPFWGPCLGREQAGMDTFRGIYAVIAREGREAFRTGLAGCARDCRRVIERSDLAALPEGRGGGISVWLGGRHRPFRPPVTPLAWRLFPAEFPGDLADFVLKVQDIHESRAQRGESFPEMTARMGLAAVEKLLGISPQSMTSAPEPGPEAALKSAAISTTGTANVAGAVTAGGTDVTAPPRPAKDAAGAGARDAIPRSMPAASSPPSEGAADAEGGKAAEAVGAPETAVAVGTPETPVVFDVPETAEALAPADAAVTGEAFVPDGAFGAPETGEAFVPDEAFGTTDTGEAFVPDGAFESDQAFGPADDIAEPAASEAANEVTGALAPAQADLEIYTGAALASEAGTPALPVAHDPGAGSLTPRADSATDAADVCDPSEDTVTTGETGAFPEPAVAGIDTYEAAPPTEPVAWATGAETLVPFQDLTDDTAGAYAPAPDAASDQDEDASDGPPASNTGAETLAAPADSADDAVIARHPSQDASFGKEDASFDKEEASFDKEEASLGQEEATLGQEEASFDQEGSSFGQEGSSFGQEGATFGQEGATFGQEGATFGQEGATFGQEGATFGQEGSSFGQEGASFGQEGASFGQDDASFGLEGASFGQEDASFGQKDEVAGGPATYVPNPDAVEPWSDATTDDAGSYGIVPDDAASGDAETWPVPAAGDVGPTKAVPPAGPETFDAGAGPFATLQDTAADEVGIFDADMYAAHAPEAVDLAALSAFKERYETEPVSSDAEDETADNLVTSAGPADYAIGTYIPDLDAAHAPESGYPTDPAAYDAGAETEATANNAEAENAGILVPPSVSADFTVDTYIPDLDAAHAPETGYPTFPTACDAGAETEATSCDAEAENADISVPPSVSADYAVDTYIPGQDVAIAPEAGDPAACNAGAETEAVAFDAGAKTAETIVSPAISADYSVGTCYPGQDAAISPEAGYPAEPVAYDAGAETADAFVPPAGPADYDIGISYPGQDAASAPEAWDPVEPFACDAGAETDAVAVPGAEPAETSVQPADSVDYTVSANYSAQDASLAPGADDLTVPAAFEAGAGTADTLVTPAGSADYPLGTYYPGQDAALAPGAEDLTEPPAFEAGAGTADTLVTPAGSADYPLGTYCPGQDAALATGAVDLSEPTAFEAGAGTADTFVTPAGSADYPLGTYCPAQDASLAPEADAQAQQTEHDAD